MKGDRLLWCNGGWAYEGGGYWFDGLGRLAFALHDERARPTREKNVSMRLQITQTPTVFSFSGGSTRTSPKTGKQSLPP